MALSLSPSQAAHTSLLSSKPLQSCSTPRPFSTIVQVNKSNDEILPVNQTSPPLRGFGPITHNCDMNKLATPSQVVQDLPSWTPLRTLEEGSSASDTNVDELSSRKATNTEIRKQHARLETNVQSTTGELKDTVTTGQTPGASSDAGPSKKRARFDGVFIAKKPLLHKRLANIRTQSRKRSDSSAGSFSLVDALARTFDANRYTEDILSRPSRARAPKSHDDVSAGPQTDIETTEAEDERFQLNTRLAPRSLKRGPTMLIPPSARASETNSEDVAFLALAERPAKRIKAIPYEVNAVAIDAALGTVEAPISWEVVEAVMHEGEDVTSTQSVRVASADAAADAPMAADEAEFMAAAVVPAADEEQGSDPAPTQIHEPNQNTSILAWVPSKRTVLIHSASRGAKFRQSLEATFGANATVRTDRVARPRPVDLELIATLDELEHEREHSLSPSGSTASASPTPSVVEEIASGPPSTHITNQSPDDPPPVDTISMRLVEADTSVNPVPSASEEQMLSWVTGLQRLVKGKVRVKEEDLETLSLNLAEIESVKDGLDHSLSMTAELRESVKQLSELLEIPFGDRNKLRSRAANIFHTWPSMRKPGAL